MWAQASWLSSKNARSTRPVPSSRVVKMTRRPERMGGVWVAALAPHDQHGPAVFGVAQPPGRDHAQFGQEGVVVRHQVA